MLVGADPSEKSSARFIPRHFQLIFLTHFFEVVIQLPEIGTLTEFVTSTQNEIGSVCR